MNSENSKTSDPYRILLNVTDKINLKTSDEYVALSKNEFKISVPRWNEEFELPDASYSVSDIQNYFEYIIKKHETVTDNSSITIYVNKIENGITFKIKTG